MKEESFKIVKMVLERNDSSGGGSLKIKRLDNITEILDLNEILLTSDQQDTIIYVKYDPKKDNYTFNMYQKDKKEPLASLKGKK